MAIRLESSTFTFQISTFSTDVSTVDTVGPLNSEGTALLSVASLSWDVANFVGYTEYTTRDIEPDKPTDPVRFDALFADQDGYYVTLGYRMGKYLPHITYATIDSDPAGPVPGFSPGDRQDSITLGLRYEINDSTALKMEYAQVELEAFAGNDGLYNGVTTALDEDKASVISVAVDVIF